MLRLASSITFCAVLTCCSNLTGPRSNLVQVPAVIRNVSASGDYISFSVPVELVLEPGDTVIVKYCANELMYTVESQQASTWTPEFGIACEERKIYDSTYAGPLTLHYVEHAAVKKTAGKNLRIVLGGHGNNGGKQGLVSSIFRLSPN